jgi:hypothetical protein
MCRGACTSAGGPSLGRRRQAGRGPRCCISTAYSIQGSRAGPGEGGGGERGGRRLGCVQRPCVRPWAHCCRQAPTSLALRQGPMPNSLMRFPSSRHCGMTRNSRSMALSCGIRRWAAARAAALHGSAVRSKTAAPVSGGAPAGGQVLAGLLVEQQLLHLGRPRPPPARQPAGPAEPQPSRHPRTQHQPARQRPGRHPVRQTVPDRTAQHQDCHSSWCLPPPNPPQPPQPGPPRPAPSAP